VIALASKTGVSRSVFRLITLALLVVGLCGCSLSLPGEFGCIERRIKSCADQLLKERPQSSKTLSLRGRKIHYVEVTDNESKPLVLFIHGSPGDWTAWAQYLNDPDLRRSAHLIALDRPGFGGSEAGRVERSVSEQAMEIAPLLSNASSGKKVLVVGHSYGGPVAARMAMDYPKKVTDLLLLAGSIDPSQERNEWYQYLAEWPGLKSIVPREIIVANQEIMALKQSLTEMLPFWPSITQRVTVIQGERDNLVAPENADFAKKEIKNSSQLTIVRLPEQNHFIPWNRYELVKSTILNSLR